jgi:hypothetical protein
LLALELFGIKFAKVLFTFSVCLLAELELLDVSEEQEPEKNFVHWLEMGMVQY